MPQATPELVELLTSAAQGGLANVYVAMPGTIISYDHTTKTAKVKPGIIRTIFDENDQPIQEVLPPFENVPVIFFSCGRFSIHAELQAGDKVRLIFQSDGVTEWRQGQLDQVAPDDLKRLGLSYPTCDPGFFPDNALMPDTDDSMGRPGGLRIHFGDSAISIGGGADFVAMAAKVKSDLDAIQSKFDSHTHAVPSLGTSAVPVPLIGTLPGVASTNLKAD